MFPTLLLVTFLAVGQSGAGPRAPNTDQTVPVARGAHLTVDNFAGEVVIRAWGRDAVRVQAKHMPRTQVSVETTPSGVAISASGMRGPASAVDYEISVPAWMPVKVDGTYAFITVEGTESEIAAETVRGDIRIKGGLTISAETIDGSIVIEGAKGRITASSVNQGIRITGASGDIAAETTKSSIVLTGISSETVDVGSVNGSLTYDGTPAPQGRYRFSTHNGRIAVAVPETAGAVFNVRTYHGSMQTNLPLQGGGDVSRGRRGVFTLGGGGAEFDLESFGGTIHIRRRGTLPADAPKEKSRD